MQGYGLTEAAPNVLCLPPEDARRKLGFAGKPYPHVDVALRDAETGTLVEGAGTGELVVRGPNVFAGYWRNPEATAAAFADGWLLTGDVAERDEEGFYRIAGRIKDMVVSGGENVYPAEIEDVLAGHDAVLEAAVVGVPDERWGEACAAFVVLREGASATEQELREHCGERLARFKVPKTLHVRRRAASVVDGEGPEGRAPRRPRGGAAVNPRPRPVSTGARSRSAASGRAAGCSRPRSPSSPSSATTTPRS